MTRKDEGRYETDPADGLKREIIGEWSSEKHERLRRYVDITRTTRKKFSTNAPSYIDLYCATGRARIRDSQPEEVVDGSAIVAAMALPPPEGFSEIYLGDLDADHLDACSNRLRLRNAPQKIHTFHGAAVDTAKAVVQRINKYGLHLAFLDPYSIGALPFSVIETLGSIPRMDLLIHLSENDLQRNVIGKQEYHRLEQFAPGWDKHVDPRQPAHVVKRQILEVWKRNVEALGYKVSDNIERVTGTKNQPLYWLVLAARNDLADKFWKAVSNVGAQRSLFA